MNKMILSIHEPCNQAWDAMTETEKGRFCNSCSKTVVDFTSMSDAQLINYFLEQKNQQVCGRLMSDQLDTVLSPAEPVRKRFGYWKYIAASALLFFTKASLKAQIKVDRSPQEHTSSLNKKADSVVFNAPQTLEEVKVTANSTHRNGRYSMMGAMSVVTIIRSTRRVDTLRAIATSITGAAKIFPNPVVRGNSFSLSLNLKAAGDYNIEIISASGALLTHQQIEISSLKSTHQIATDSRWATGIYFVRLTDAVHKEIATCKLVLN
jgi:hypothetical protein